MTIRLERTGYVRASVSAFLGASLGAALLLLTRQYAWSPWSVVALATLPLWGATACWVSLRRAHIKGYAGTSFIAFLSVLLSVGGAPLLSVPLFAGLGGALGRLLGSDFSSREDRQQDPRWAKIAVVSLALLAVVGVGLPLLFLQAAIVDGWDQDRAFALRVSDDAVCSKEITEACAQEAASRRDGQVAWLDSIPEKDFVQFTATDAGDRRAGTAVESFVTEDGPPRVIRLTSGFPSLAPEEDTQSTTKTLDGVSYHLSTSHLSTSEADRPGLWDFATLSWQIDGTHFNITLDGGLFGGPIKPESLIDLVPSLRYAQPHDRSANSVSAHP